MNTDPEPILVECPDCGGLGLDREQFEDEDYLDDIDECSTCRGMGEVNQEESKE